MYRKIDKIAEVFSGYTFRGRVEEDPQGDIFVLQAKDLSAYLDISGVNRLVPVSSESLRRPLFLRYNDVLLVSRATGTGLFRSTVFTGAAENVMPSSSVHVIRVNDVSILPKYLSLYLNSEAGQKSLQQIVTGAYVQSILIKNLLEYQIPIPPIHAQKTLIALYENFLKQKQLVKRKQELKQNIINAVFINLKETQP